jgi:hypothetical protein
LRIHLRNGVSMFPSSTPAHPHWKILGAIKNPGREIIAARAFVATIVTSRRWSQ